MSQNIQKLYYCDNIFKFVFNLKTNLKIENIYI